MPKNSGSLSPEIEPGSIPVKVISPSRGLIPVNLHDIWEYRELLYFLALRDIKVRYKQTLLGVAWAIIQPFCMMLVFTLFFGYLVKVPSEGIPYPLFSYSALLPWTLLSECINRSSNSMLTDANLIRKVYFPRLLMPLSSIVTPLLDFAIAFTVLLGMMFYFGYPPTMSILWLPVFILLEVITALGIGFWLSAINVQYRDVAYATPFLIQLWFFASPVIYPSSLIPQQYQLIYGLNPMAVVVEGSRWALLHTSPPGHIIAVPAAIVILILISGAFYFRHCEKRFADVI